MELQQFDKASNVKIPRHKLPSSTDDELETPKDKFQEWCYKYGIYPQLDVAATKQNALCPFYFTKEENALNHEWLMDAWCNHPHTLHAEFVEKCYLENKNNNINILQLIPANCVRTKYWHKYIEDKVEYHAIEGNITFLKNGKPVLNKEGQIQSARNAYFLVIWRKKT